MADITRDESVEVVLIDGAGTNEAVVNSDGSVNARRYDSSGNAITNGQKTMANSVPIVVASDQTTIPVSIGLPFFLAYTFGFATAINQPTAGSDNPLILLKNPSGSGKTVYLSFVAYGINVANVLGNIRIFKSPTITSNGTSETVQSFGGGTTAVNLYSTPTISANGTLISSFVTGQNSSSVLVPINFEISVAANSNILITGNPGSNNRNAEISMRWIEL